MLKQRELDEYKRAVDAYIQRNTNVTSEDVVRLNERDYIVLFMAGIPPAKVGQGIIDGSFKRKE